MKIIAHTMAYGLRIRVNIQWSRAFYFAGEQPDANRLVTLDLPELDGSSADKVAAWLAKQTTGSDDKALLSKKRRELSEFSEEHWRYTVLEDYLDAENYNYFYWHITQHFALAEIVAFESKHLPRAWDAAREIEATPADDYAARDAALARIEDLFHRAHAAAYGSMNRVATERQAAQQGRDRELVTAFDTQGAPDLDDWAALLAGLSTWLVRQEVLTRLGSWIASQTHESTELIAIVNKLHRKKVIREAIASFPQFWVPIVPWLTLPPTEREVTIDISDAVEVVVPMHYVLFEAKRVGPIVPGRRALCIPTANSKQKPTYIRADRRLQFQILERGGSMRKHGCTLKVDLDGNSIRPLLTQVEELIVLANLSPSGALAKITDLELPAGHPVHAAAERAVDDHRWARIFADLLIELRTGLDADVARRLVG